MCQLKFIKMMFLSLCIFICSAPIFAQTSVESSTQSNLGGTAQSQNFSLTATAGGQASPIGEAARSAQFSLLSGSATVVVSVNKEPEIIHTVQTLVNANEAITIIATITDDFGIESALLKFREGGRSEFITVALSGADSTFTGTIPADAVTSSGVEYFIQAEDLGGLTKRIPTSGIFSIQVTLPDPGVTKSSPQPSGSVQTAYRLISVPIRADNVNVSAVLSDDLDAYDDTRWRFFELKADQSYAEFPSTSGMTPGKSFWLIVKDAGKIIDTGSGRSNTTSAEFAISLHAGWNFIANPFNFPIPLSNVRMESGTNLDIRFFNGSQFSTFTSSLNPFDGYAVYSENSDRLIVDPLLFPPTSQSQKGTTGTDNEDVIWSIRIMAQCQEALDTYNFASVVSGASEGWDQHDRPEAPVIGEYVSVYFPHPEWGKVSPIYATDARPEPLEGDIWEFEVKSNIKDKVTLNFAVLESVPEDYEIWLVDDAVKSSLNLRSTQEYTFASYGKEYPKKLKLVVGKQEYIDNQFDSIDFVPESYELYQNFPNPFNPITAISYGLPFDSKVTIRIYNLLGEEIITLVNNQQTKAGYHTIIWDGRNSYNSKVATGMYIYQMISGRFIQNKKMVLVE